MHLLKKEVQHGKKLGRNMRYKIKIVKAIHGGGHTWSGMNYYANRSERVGFRMRKKEIRVTNSGIKAEGNALIRHEIIESRCMKNGMPYWRAHAIASRISGV